MEGKLKYTLGLSLLVILVMGLFRLPFDRVYAQTPRSYNSPNQPQPTVTSITPASGLSGGVIHITDLSGANFQTGAAVKLTRAGEADINATNVNVQNASKITCDLGLAGAAPGQWTVRVTNPDNEFGELADGFTVEVATYLPLVGRNWRPQIPREPSNVQASDGTYADKVSVTWDGSTGATTYEVYRGTSSGGSKTKLGSPAATSYDDTTAQEGTTYYYWVKACNSYGCSDYSAHDTGYAEGTPPTEPANVQASDGTYTDRVYVTWNGSTGATTYEVYRATSSGGSKSKLGSPTGTSYNDTSVDVGTTYYYWVKACNSYGCSDYSAHDTGYAEGTPPTEPTNVQASDGTYTDRVRVTWNGSTGATTYEVYRATSSGGSKSKLGSPTGTSYNDTSADVGTTYYYWVKACNSYGCSDYSAHDTGYAEGMPPTEPTNVQASDGTYTDRVRVTWNGSTGATTYEVYRATSSGGSKSKLGSPTGTSYNDTSADVGTTYYYWVKACNDFGCSDYSAHDTGYREEPPPTEPTNVQASDGTYTDKVRVTWSGSSEATYYEVYRATSSGGSKSKRGSPTGTSYNDTSADVGTTYYYWVKACNSYGCSDYSNYNTGWRARPLCADPGTWNGSGSGKVTLVRLIVSSGSTAVTEFEMSWASPGACGLINVKVSGTMPIDSQCSFGGRVNDPVTGLEFTWAGDFIAPTSATGTWSVTQGACADNGTWQANSTGALRPVPSFGWAKDSVPNSNSADNAGPKLVCTFHLYGVEEENEPHKR